MPISFPLPFALHPHFPLLYQNVSPPHLHEPIPPRPGISTTENFYAKALTLKIRNSIAHLQRSNLQLQWYFDAIRVNTSIDENVKTPRLVATSSSGA